MQEIWKDIIGYEGYYKVSITGSVKRIPCVITTKRNRPYTISGGLLKQHAGKRGYYTVALCKMGVSKTMTIHRLIAIHFLENPLNKPQINHIDGNRLNNNISNLEWATNRENTIHSYEHLDRMSGMKGKINKGKRKKIIQFDLNNNLIKSYDSITIADSKTGINYRLISACANNRQKTAGGFKWRFQ